jgi:class 3 adenylate cyclase
VSPLPSGTVTFLFTDIEGSTELLRTLGDGYAELLRQERSILRETLTHAEGHEIDTQGDAFFFSFPRTRDAVAGAVTAQRALREHEWPQGVEVKVRMGLHTGEPTVGDEGYVGLDVVRTARICSAGHGGQILMSETTRALLGDALPDRTTLRDLGLRSLKDVGEERIFQLTLDGRDDFAPLKTEGGLSKSAANVLGDDFDQRIEDLVKSSIAGRLPGASPPEPPSKPFWSRFGRRPRR